MRQSRVMSPVEVVTNVVVGYGVAVLVPMLLPSARAHGYVRQNLAIGLVFTAVSIVRSFALRRLFERFRA